MRKSFTIHRDNGVFLQFPNGNSISTIWGYGSYTENYNKNENGTMESRFRNFPDGSNDVEVMISCPDKLHKAIQKKFRGDGSVIGHLTIDDWMYIINRLYKQK
jgi:hypothetical protein